MSTANFYNDDCFNIFTGNDNFEFATSQLNYSYFNLDKNQELDPTMEGSVYKGYNPVNGMDYLNQDLERGAHLLIQQGDMGDQGMNEQVKNYHPEYVNCESFSTRYTDGSFESKNTQNMSLNYNMDSLTESMLKQLDTPKLFSMNEAEVPESLRLNSLDPQIIKRLHEAGINVNNETKEEYYNENEQYYESMGDMEGKKDKYKGTRRKGKKVEEIKTMTTIKPIQMKSPQLKTTKTKNTTKTTFGTMNYNWIKDSFFNCQILGNVVSIAQDQTGCRMLQRQLECNDYQFIASVLKEVLENIYMLMTDPFGNYLCQKLMSVCDAEQLGMIITACEPQFIQICLNMHGTRAIQKLIEVVADSNIDRITKILSKGVVELVNDLNGNHVIQKCLVSLSSKHCEFIYKAMNHNCIYLATHRHGCCVMQRCIDAASPSQRSKLVETISSKTLELVEDAYGNYVIQYVLRLKDDEVNSKIVSYLCEDVTKYAKQKFSSNVVERCLIFCQLEVRSKIINQFLKVPFEVLKELILDPFGNYVIQRVLNVAQPEELTELLDRIQPHIEELKVAYSGKRIAAKISRRSNTNMANSGGMGMMSQGNMSATNMNYNNGSGINIFEILSDNQETNSYPGMLNQEYPSLSTNYGMGNNIFNNNNYNNNNYNSNNTSNNNNNIYNTNNNVNNNNYNSNNYINSNGNGNGNGSVTPASYSLNGNYMSSNEEEKDEAKYTRKQREYLMDIINSSNLRDKEQNKDYISELMSNNMRRE